MQAFGVEGDGGCAEALVAGIATTAVARARTTVRRVIMMYSECSGNPTFGATWTPAVIGRGESARVSSPADPVSIPWRSRPARAHATRARRPVTSNSANGAGPKAQSERTRQLGRPAFARGPSACVTRPIAKASLTEPRAPTLAPTTRQTRHTHRTGTGSSCFDGGRRTADGERTADRSGVPAQSTVAPQQRDVRYASQLPERARAPDHRACA